MSGPGALTTDAATEAVSDGGVHCWSLGPVGGDIVSKSVLWLLAKTDAEIEDISATSVQGALAEKHSELTC